MADPVLDVDSFELVAQQKPPVAKAGPNFSARNVYAIPTGVNVVISFSGGRTSGYLLKQVLDAAGGSLPSNCKVIFQNTGKEKEETLQFIHRVSQEWNVPIVWLEYATKNQFKEVDFHGANRTGEPFKQMIIDRPYYLPNAIQRICTINMKNIVMSLYCRDVLGWYEIENWTGIRADESKRYGMEGPNKNNKIVDEDKYLPLRWGKVTKPQILHWWANQSFDLALGPNEGNCDLCLLKGVDNILSEIRQNPALADWWIEMEDMVSEYRKTRTVFRSDRPDYRKLKQIAIDQPDYFVGDSDLAACNCTD